ncbi:MAG: uracil-DNA glycosylase [Longimicrobiaceae bacterium]|jgi:DNA polymerase
MSQAKELLRRYLRQRGELGETELFLDRYTAGELRDLLAASPAAPARAAVLTPVERAAGAPAPGATAPEIVQIGSLAELREVALGCPRCRLAETRQHVVFGEGNPQAQVVVVGEAPGAEEDRTGRPFVGRAGKLLDLLLASVGFAREQVFICNVLKCRPPGNRNPQPDEIAACSPYLLRQIELLGPRVILACGTFAAQTLLATSVSISKLRGGIHHYHGVPLIATYHPAALLRNAAWVRLTWEDLQRLRGVLDSA